MAWCEPTTLVGLTCFNMFIFLFQYLQQTVVVTEGRRLFRTLLSALETNLRPLFNAFSEVPRAALLRRVLALSQSQGGLWSLTLKSAMSDSMGDECMSHVLVDLIMCEESDYNEQKLQTLQCLIGAETSIYNLKIVVENYSKMLGDTDANNITGKGLFIEPNYNWFTLYTRNRSESYEINEP